jgi:hypothetical protein
VSLGAVGAEADGAGPQSGDDAGVRPMTW